MSWRKIPMKFPGACIVCKKKIGINEVGLWAKGLGVKHLACAEVVELRCLVCGGPAGCFNVNLEMIVTCLRCHNYAYVKNVTI